MRLFYDGHFSYDDEQSDPIDTRGDHRPLDRVGTGDTAQPGEAGLRTALEGFAVDGDESEGGFPSAPLEVVQQAPVQVATDVDPIIHRIAQVPQGFACVGDPAFVILGSDAVLGDKDRDISDDIVGMAHGNAQRVWAVCPAHEGVIWVFRVGNDTVLVDELASVGLHPNKVVIAREFEVPVFPYVLHFGVLLVPAGCRDKCLVGNGPAHLRASGCPHKWRGGTVGGHQSLPNLRVRQSAELVFLTACDAALLTVDDSEDVRFVDCAYPLDAIKDGARLLDVAGE